MRLFVQVILFTQDTLTLFKTPITTIRGVKQFIADLLFELLAHGIAIITCGTFLSTIRLIGAKLIFIAIMLFNTSVTGSIGGVFIALYSPGADFA
jgi:hypothetical protein